MLLARVGGVTQPIQASVQMRDAGTSGDPPQASAIVELPRGLRPGVYPLEISADGGVTFLPASKDPALNVEVL